MSLMDTITPEVVVEEIPEGDSESVVVTEGEEEEAVSVVSEDEVNALSEEVNISSEEEVNNVSGGEEEVKVTLPEGSPVLIREPSISKNVYKKNLSQGQMMYKTLKEIRRCNTRRIVDQFENLC